MGSVVGPPDSLGPNTERTKPLARTGSGGATPAPMRSHRFPQPQGEGGLLTALTGAKEGQNTMIR